MAVPGNRGHHRRERESARERSELQTRVEANRRIRVNGQSPERGITLGIQCSLVCITYTVLIHSFCFGMDLDAGRTLESNRKAFIWWPSILYSIHGTAILIHACLTVDNFDDPHKSPSQVSKKALDLRRFRRVCPFRVQL